MNNQINANEPFKMVNICGFNVWVRSDKISGLNDVLIAQGPLRDEYGLDQIAETGDPIEWVLDIGAFVGTFSMKVKRLWPDAKVIAFEPSPESAKLYRLNTAGFKNITFHEAAVVRREDAGTVHLVQNNTFHAARRVAEVISQFGEKGATGDPVSAVALIDVLKAHGSPDIAILKIDAEGAEADILEDLRSAGYLDRIKWIRGEWHFFSSIPRIETALRSTHDFRIYREQHPWGAFEAGRNAMLYDVTSRK